MIHVRTAQHLMKMIHYLLLLLLLLPTLIVHGSPGVNGVTVIALRKLKALSVFPSIQVRLSNIYVSPLPATICKTFSSFASNSMTVESCDASVAMRTQSCSCNQQTQCTWTSWSSWSSCDCENEQGIHFKKKYGNSIRY